MRDWRPAAFAAVLLAVVASSDPAGQTAVAVPAACATFTDDPLTANTPMRVAHLQELRACINALRTQVGLATFSWADATITAGVTPARAAQLIELRTALNGVYAAIGLTPPAYTDPSVAAGAVAARAVQLQEIREAARVAGLPVATAPTVSPAAGTYGTPQTVTLSASPGSVIRFTLDGSVPTAGSPAFALPLAVDTAVTLRARVFQSGHNPSPVVTAAFAFQVADPTLTPLPGSYQTTQQVQIATTSPGVTLRFTTDGTTPTESSPVFSSAFVLNPPSALSLQTRGFRAGWTPSAVIEGDYVVDVNAIAPPALSPVSGTYAVGQAVTLSTTVSGAEIRYTLDGSTPTASSLLFSGPLVLNEPTIIKARTFRPGSPASAIAQAVYALKVPTPLVSPLGGEFSSAPSVTVSNVASGATVRHTLNGNVPTASSPVFVSGTFVPLGSTLTVKAFKDGWAASDDQVQVYVSDALPPISGGGVSPSGAAASGFSAVNGAAVFTMSGAFLTGNASDITAYRDQTILPVTAGSATSFTVGGLIEGANQLTVYGVDSQGLPFETGAEVWAGSRTVTVTVVDPSGTVIPGATVTGALADNDSVFTTATTDGLGRAFLAQTPSGETLGVSVTAAGFRDSWGTIASGQTASTLALDLDNNDFSSNLAGWTNGAGVNAFTQPHSEAFPGWVSCPDCMERPDAESVMVAAGVAAATADADLFLVTKNTMAPQAVTRRFRATAGVGTVTVRYRFATTELQSPTPRNDAFGVQLTNLDTNAAAVDNQTVFSLSGQLDGQGATAWRTLTLNAAENQLIQLTLTAQNAQDGAFMSVVIADKVAEQGVRIADLRLFDRRSKASANVFEPLRYLSASGHSAYPNTTHAGKTPIHGTIQFLGTPGDSLKEVKLEVFQSGDPARKATGVLSPEATSVLIGPTFPTDGLRITAPTLMFLIPSSELATVNQTTNGQLTLKVVATTAQGRTHTKEWKATKLVWYTNPNRYGGRDLDNCIGATAPPNFPCGGDSWALPLTVSRSAAVAGVVFGDFSNMNGGLFPDHSSHTDGDDVDVAWVTGTKLHFEVNKATAERLIQLFQSHDASIDFVYVTFDVSQPGQDPIEFWQTIRNAQVNGVRLIPEDAAIDAETKGNSEAQKRKWTIRSKGRIRFRPGHETHFHIRWKR